MKICELVNREVVMKDTDSLFDDYVSTYPFSKVNALNTLQSINLKAGRMLLYEGFFLWFSEYYPLYCNTLNRLMGNDKYFPITWKYYLALMAVSTIRCDYLLQKLEIKFLEYGGDQTWLIEGLAVVPEKIKKLAKINNILAHQSWKLKTQDIHVKNSNYRIYAVNMIIIDGIKMNYFMLYLS
jgi:hypothetical protein